VKKNLKEKLLETVTNGEPAIDANVFLDKSQLAKILQVSVGTVNNRVADGTLAHLKFGRRILFHRDTIFAQLVRAQRGGLQ
jgi:excisionase family DNA binding protein